MKEISSLLRQGIECGDFPGASYAVVYKNGSVDQDYLGYKQLEPHSVFNEGWEIYDCASLTKVICTTTLIMQMIEKNKLGLQTKVSDILPKFKHQTITIKHLLTHTSGLPADIPNAKSLGDKKMVMTKIYGFDLMNPVGKHVVYSDIGFILLGLIIERLTGQTLDKNAKEKIFEPLGMNDSSFHPKVERCAPTEFRHDQVYHGLLQGRVHDEKAFALGGVAGHAGLFSTVNDLSKFILSLLKNDGKILDPKTVDLLYEIQASSVNENGTILHRTLGWNKPSIGGTAGDNTSFENTILHTGFTGCNIWLERKKGIGFVMLSNAVHPSRSRNNIIKYRNQIGNLILSSRRKNK